MDSRRPFPWGPGGRAESRHSTRNVTPGPSADASPHDHADRPYEWVGAWSQRRAQLTPDRVGIREPAADAAYTYADLDERANRTANLLRDLDVSTDDRVAVLSRNRVELVDLFFATAKTGSLLAPLSHRLAERDLAAVIGDVDPCVVVVETPFEAELIDALELCDVDPVVRSLPTDDDYRYDPLDIDRQEPDFDAVETALSDPHLLLHTGGSTGTPKETVLTHGGLYWNAFGTIASWGIRPDDVTPVSFPMFHTGGWNILTLPCFGMGATVLLRREPHPERVLADVERESATILVGTPTDLGEMARHDAWSGTDLSSLRFVKSGGGPCREHVIDAWRDRGVDFSQGYGLTEFGPNNFAMPSDAPPEKVDSVGVPAMCVDYRLVDEAGERVASGEIGKLELAGPAAAAGYWGDTDAATFGEWVSTGDLARVDADGYVHIEGRIDDMFVTAGENVYPQRIEDAIVEHPDVETAIVFGIPDDRLGAVPKAVVVGDDSLTLDELEAFLERRVADFAVPTALAVVDGLPGSGTGKVDRSAVKERFGPDEEG